MQDIIEDLQLTSSSDEEPALECANHMHIKYLLQLLIMWQFIFRVFNAAVTAFFTYLSEFHCI